MTFALDLDSNPHPRMLVGALAVRAAARRNVVGPARHRWEGYLTAMADATGCDPTDLEAWMDRHEDPDAVPGDRQRPSGA